MRFDENPFTRQCEEESKKALGFQQGFRFRTFIGRFVVVEVTAMAVKGLTLVSSGRVLVIFNDGDL